MAAIVHKSPRFLFEGRRIPFRAETLKKHFQSQEEQKSQSVSANGTIAGVRDKGNGGEEDNPELKKLRASLSSAILSKKTNVKWDDVAGLDGAKASLKEGVIYQPNFLTPWKGILLYGPLRWESHISPKRW